MSIFGKLRRVDSRYIWLILVILAAVPLLTPLGLPVSSKATTIKWIQQIDSLKPGDVVLWNQEVGSIAWTSSYPMFRVNVEQVWQKQAKILFFTTTADALEITKRISDQAPSTAKKVYGTDWVIAPWVAGAETGVAAFVRDIWGTSGNKDYYGTSYDALPLMKNLKTAADFQLCILTTAGGPDVVIRQIGIPYGIPVMVMAGADQESILGSWYGAGMLKSFLAGMPDFATYEKYMQTTYNLPLADATKQMDIVSTTHLYCMILIVMGNVAFVAEKYRGKGEVKVKQEGGA